MNVNFLYSITWDLLDELKELEVVSLMDKLRSSLQDISSQPQNVSFQNAFKEARGELIAVLGKAPSNSFAPRTRSAMIEMEVNTYFGKELARDIKKIFASNEQLLATVLPEFTKLHESVFGIQDKLENLKESLEFLEFGYEGLEHNEAELGITIPNEFIKGNLKRFGQEVRTLDGILGLYQELVTGNREPLRLREISSWEPSIFVFLDPNVLLLFCQSLESIVNMLKGVIEITRAVNLMRKQRLPEDQLRPIEQFKETRISTQIDELSIEITRDVEDEGRKNELVNEAKGTLRQLVNRLTSGFEFLPRVADEEDVENGENGGENTRVIREKIRVIARNLSTTKITKVPMFLLPDETSEVDKQEKSKLQNK